MVFAVCSSGSEDIYNVCIYPENSVHGRMHAGARIRLSNQE